MGPILIVTFTSCVINSGNAKMRRTKPNSRDNAFFIYTGYFKIIGRVCRNDAKVVINVINWFNYHAYKDMIPKEYSKHPVVTVNRILRDMKDLEFFMYTS